MAERLDVLIASKYQTKTGETKSKFQRVGAAFSTRNGGWSIKVDAPIVIVPGMSDLVLFPPKQDEGGGQQSGGDDPLPF